MKRKNEQKNIEFEISKGCINKEESIRLKVDTKQFKIAVPGDDPFLCSMDSDDVVEGQIQALKAKLREKKNA